MKVKSDAQLLIEYAEQGSEAAFGEIVARHTDLVYSAALRRVCSRDLASDVAQSVFTDLARKASSLARRLPVDATLVGWLYAATRYASMTMLRVERRRQTREREAMQPLDSTPEPQPDWDRLRPVLDEAMAGLGEQDRTALLLRYFRNEDLRVVGSALGISDDAAQKRVARSLEKLRKLLARRGATTTGAALATTLSLNAVLAAPIGLASTLASASLATAAGVGGELTLLKLMAMTKVKAGVVVAVVLAGLATSLTVQHFSLAKLRGENAGLRELSRQLAELRAENQRLAKLQVDRDELERLRRAHIELLRLRGEVGRLRRELVGQSRLNASIAGEVATEVPTNTSPAQITIETKFAVLPPNLSAGLGARRAGMTGVLTDLELRALLKELEETSGIDFLSAPKVTTLSGRQAQIAVVDIRPVEEDSFNDQSGKPAGPVLDVIPTLGADGWSISLKALVQYPATRLATDELTSNPNLPWVSATIEDGQTLLHSQVTESSEGRNRGEDLLVLITATVIDPAGNRIHTADDVARRGGESMPQPGVFPNAPAE